MKARRDGAPRAEAVVGDYRSMLGLLGATFPGSVRVVKRPD